MSKPVQRKLSKRYDAYYSVKTGVWLERKCPPDANCRYCTKRPARFPVKRRG